MRVLVTGGAGFIGSHIVEHFNSVEGVEVRVLDNFRTGHWDNISAFDVQMIEGSVADERVVSQAVKGVDYVFHLAALVSVQESMELPDDCVRINTQGTLNILKAALQHRAKKVIFSSTSAVYGDDPSLPKTEDMTPAPLSPYAVTKLDGEYYMEIFRREFGSSACVRRPCGTSTCLGRGRTPARRTLRPSRSSYRERSRMTRS
jgi:UDP-glucose 4-epimerase